MEEDLKITIRSSIETDIYKVYMMYESRGKVYSKCYIIMHHEWKIENTL